MDTTLTNGFWSPRRFGQLLLRELVTGYRSLLIAMAAIGGFIIVISVLTGLGITMSARPGETISGEYYLGFFQNLLFVGGFIVTSLAFREMWHNGGGVFYLTIPGSIFEKLTTKLLMTSIGYAAGCLVYFTAVAAIGHGITQLIFGVAPGLFNPLTTGVFRLILIYLVVQSVFLLGSVWFRKVALIKTMLWGVIFAIGLGIILAVVARIALADHFVWHAATNGAFRGAWNLDLGNGRLQTVFAPGTSAWAGLMVFRTVGRVLLWVAAPVMWLASYFRLHEVEV
jgi:hypothetical protein